MKLSTLFIIAIAAVCAIPAEGARKNEQKTPPAPPLVEMADIPAGIFYMGGRGAGEDFDEAPVHKVTISRPFRMSVNEITNAQYELFDPSHRSLRGIDGVSTADNGRTWSYRPSPFNPIDGGQRLVLRRLNEGPLLPIAFTDHPDRTPEPYRGMTFTRPDGSTFTGRGLYAALSFDEGLTWPVRRLITDSTERLLDGGAWTGMFLMSDTTAEPKGYLAATQTPDGTIHLLSSRLHYRFNLPWLLGKKPHTEAPCP